MEPYLGEIRLVSFNFAARNWALCDGQLLSINQNQALFSLLGTSHGGDGQTTFALPDLRGALPMHMSGAYPLGAVGGEVNHTLALRELPAHTHMMSAVASANTTNPADGYIAASGKPAYAASPNVSMNRASVSGVGGSQPHNNLPPFLVMSFMIATSGIFPSRD